MKRYRLKRNAVPYFDDKYADKIYSYNVWEKDNISINALEEVEPIYISYGFDKKGYTDLSGWSNDDGAHFHFTINFPLTNLKEYNLIKTRMPDIMRDIQNIVNQKTKDFTKQ